MNKTKNHLTVMEAKEILGICDETLKRRLRRGEFPSAYKETDKHRWRIPLEDIKLYLENSNTILSVEILNKNDIIELSKIAYEAVTMTSPSEEIVEALSRVGIKRTLEILLVMQQYPTEIEHPSDFIINLLEKKPLTTKSMRKQL